MCGRYTSTSPVEALAAAFAVDEVVAEDLGPRYNVAPTQPILAVALHHGARTLGTLRWGLVPSWAKDPSVGSRMINARAEGIATKPAYRSALERRRCLIPADAFYEWQAAPEGSPRRAPKQPWAIGRRDGAPMAFAGLWEVWRDRGDPSAPPLRSAVIVTTSANATLAPIHDRMPVVLEESAWERWLDPATDDGSRSPTDLLVPAGEGVLRAWRVPTLVNAVARDGPELLDPVPDGAG